VATCFKFIDPQFRFLKIEEIQSPLRINLKMTETNCAICCDEITQKTGVVTMSCKHSFHFACLGAWFSTQFINKQKESCPCCRHEAGEKEALPKRNIDSLNRSFDDLRWNDDHDVEPAQTEAIIQNMIGEIARRRTIIEQTNRIITTVVTADEIQNVERILGLIQEEDRQTASLTDLLHEERDTESL